MKVRRLFLITGLAALLGVVAYGIALVRRGFSTRTTPSTIEKVVATSARRLAVPSKYRRLRNPLAASSENIQAGMDHFADHCATCHGNDGSGNTMFGRGLYPKPPDMREAETQNKSDGELYYVIENGVRLSGMPAFGAEGSVENDTDTWHLVLFIRHLPQLSVAETLQMEALNPKTDDERQEEQQEQEFLSGGTQIEDSSSHHHH